MPASWWRDSEERLAGLLGVVRPAGLAVEDVAVAVTARGAWLATTTRTWRTPGDRRPPAAAQVAWARSRSATVHAHLADPWGSPTHVCR